VIFVIRDYSVMKKRSTADIRHTFLDFFQRKQHTLVASSTLVPNHDPSLLFTNAGMNQFKEFFLGLAKSPYDCAVTVQRCLRAGGKHNDLENVGYTARHHTFFEMLGNFSFGHYFKQEAIGFAWELLTSASWFALPKEKLWVTVYSSDEESYSIWADEIGVPQEHIIRIGDNLGSPYASDNFWQMGESGPCGPCTEIFYDHGTHIAGGPPGSVNADGDRFVEIWNLVFMQFNLQPEGTLQPLPIPCVDTGMGLERIAAVLQGVCSTYETDVFHALQRDIATIIQTQDQQQPAVRIIADHLRAAAFLMADGVKPSHEGRGYVLRRMIRRAVRYGQKLGVPSPFLHQLLDPLIAIMGEVAEGVAQQRIVIAEQFQSEERQFIQLLRHYSALLTDQLTSLTGDTLDGERAFKLYDTYGLPLDLTIEICREHNVAVDRVGFDQAMTAQRQRAKRSSQFAVDHHKIIPVEIPSLFCGYEALQIRSEVVGLWRESECVERINSGEAAIVFLKQTPFYATSGGQIGDQGQLTAPGKLFEVSDTDRYGEGIGHSGYLLQGQLSVGDSIDAQVDSVKRQATALNHSATHLLHAALRQLLGEQVMQKGSLVTAEYLRLDFSWCEPLSLEKRLQVEQLVNDHIRQNHLIQTEIVSLAQAKTQGALAFFDEKYADQVRLLTMGNFSKELCGGTHAMRTGEIGLFHLLSESGVAAGVRRIEAVTGATALQHWQQQQQYLLQICLLVKERSGQQLVNKVQALLQSQQTLTKKVQRLQENVALQSINKIINSAIIIKDVNIIVSLIKNSEVKTLKVIVNELQQRLDTAIILLATIVEERVHFIAAITANLTQQITATELIHEMALQVNGKGGGRAELAQGTGSDVNAVATALMAATTWVKTKL
jgi:alanyl-tRNA synthetase